MVPATPLLAFGFASPWLLWGLLAAGAPILIHLLNRRKFKETSWAAMKFLLEALRKNQRRMRMEQWLLLAVRTLLLVLVALALSRPFVAGLGAAFQANQPAHKILVIDATLSMDYRPGESSRFEQAQRTARAIVEESRQGDAFQLVRISAVPPTVVVQSPVFRAADMLSEIDQLSFSHARGELALSLEKVVPLLQTVPHLPRKEVYILSDLQRSTWVSKQGEGLAALRAAVQKLSGAARLSVIDLGQPDAGNAAVVDVRLRDRQVLVGRAAQLTATIQNLSGMATERAVDWLVDGRVIERQTVALPAGGAATRNLSHTFQSAGEHAVQIRLSADSLPLDDMRSVAIPVKDQLQVLCVSGKNTGGAMGRATDFLELALAPPQKGGGRALLQPRSISEGEFLGTDLARFDCLFLCNVKMFTPREAALLEGFAQGGGGVVFCLGDEVLPESYNRVLYRNGAGLLPARLGNRRGEPGARQRVFEFDPGEFAHPLIQAFRGNPDAGLQTTRTAVFFQTELEAGTPAKVALKFDTGDAAIVQKPFGQGEAILITTSVDDRWGNWSVWPSFLPLIQEIVQFSVSGRWGDRQHVVGDALAQTLIASAGEVEVAVRRPDGKVFPLPTSRSGSSTSFSFAETTVSGVYEVTWGHPVSRTELHAVNCDPVESDLAKYDRDELETELLKGIDFHYDTRWTPPSREATTSQTRDQSVLPRWLLYGALYLLLVEQLLSYNFRFGLWLLCPLIPVAELWRRRTARQPG